MALARTATEAGEEVLNRGPRIALLTPYAGGNLGDATIQDAMITNIRIRLTGTHFSGITLNSENFVRQHGESSFPLVATGTHFYRMDGDELRESTSYDQRGRNRPGSTNKFVQELLRLRRCFKKAAALWASVSREIRHTVDGYRFLRTQDLLVISGGGQLDEEWGGPWGHPFALAKWATLARLARVPCAAASIGACQTRSRTSRALLSIALRGCCYRSYRETKTRAVAARLLPKAAKDAVVPDVAFSLAVASLPPPREYIRSMARGRPVVVVSPICYAKPGNWPTEDRVVYDRYLQQMARMVSCLSQRNYFPVIACSSLDDNEIAKPDLLGRLSDEMRHSLDERIHLPVVKTWRDFVAILEDSDYLIASRLHSVILGFVTQTPVVAISFDPKVEWVMEDVQQTEYLLQIRDFTSQQVLAALDRVQTRRDEVVKDIADYVRNQNAESARQYDTLAQMTLAHYQSRSLQRAAWNPSLG